MLARPARLNAAIAWLFIVGSACFVLGSVPWYADKVGGVADGITYFVGSIFFTSAAFCQLVQAQSPDMTLERGRTDHEPAPVALTGWLPHDLNWLAAATQFCGTLFFNISTFVALAHNLTTQQEDRHVWRPDYFGSILFLVASVLAIRALGGHFFGVQHSQPWRSAWLNMVGSILFMFSAIGSYVLPNTGQLIDSPVATTGTLFGAVCFLAGAALMLRAPPPSRHHHPGPRTGLPQPQLKKGPP